MLSRYAVRSAANPQATDKCFGAFPGDSCIRGSGEWNEVLRVILNYEVELRKDNEYLKLQLEVAHARASSMPALPHHKGDQKPEAGEVQPSGVSVRDQEPEAGGVQPSGVSGVSVEDRITTAADSRQPRAVSPLNSIPSHAATGDR